MTTTAALDGTRQAASNDNALTRARWKGGKTLLGKAIFDVVPAQIRFRLALTIVLTLAGAVCVVVAPILFSKAIDVLVARENAASAIGLIAGSVVLFGLAKLLVEQRWLIYQPAENRVLNAIRSLYLQQILSLPVSFHVNRAIGRLDATVGQGMGGLQSLFGAVFTQAAPLLFEVMAIVLAASAFLSVEVAAVIAASIALYIAVLVVGAERVSRRYQKALGEAINAQGLAGDAILNAEGVKALAVDDAIIERYNTALGASSSAFRGFYAARGVFGLCLSAILLVGFAVAIGVTSASVLVGQQTTGALVLTNAYLLQLFRTIEGFSFSYRDARQSLSAVARFIDLFLEEKESDGGTMPIPDPLQRVTVDRVSFSYPDARMALNELSLTIDRGKVTALIGESGSGKSTIIRLLLKLYDPQEGEIQIDGIPIQQFNARELRRDTALVPQDAIMFKASLAFNIALTDAPDSDRLQNAIEAAQLSPLMLRLPEGADTEIGERGFKLSGGERQRVSIARALYRKPQILVLDEATSALDDRTRDELLVTIRALAHRFATLVITHDPMVADIADKVVKIEPPSQALQ